MSGRGSKGKGHAFPGDFIALGSKSSSGKGAAPSSSSSQMTAGIPAGKKVKSLKTGSSSGSSTAAAGASYLAGGEKLGHVTWENIAEEVEMADLVMLVESAPLPGTSR